MKNEFAHGIFATLGPYLSYPLWHDFPYVRTNTQMKDGRERFLPMIAERRVTTQQRIHARCLRNGRGVGVLLPEIMSQENVTLLSLFSGGCLRDPLFTGLS